MTLEEELEKIWKGTMWTNAHGVGPMQMMNRSAAAAEEDYRIATTATTLSYGGWEDHSYYKRMCQETKSLIKQRLVEALTHPLPYIKHFAMLVAKDAEKENV